MTTACLAGFGVWVAMVVFPAQAAAQTVARSFAELQVRVKIGDTVYVIDGSGRETKGRIDLLSAASLQLALNGNRRGFLERDVTRVERRGHRDSIRNGLLIGLGTGAVLGFLAGRGVDEGPCPPNKGCGEAELIGTFGGAFWGGVAGWITDALIRRREVVYLAPGQQ
jgi:hypothetical protein